MSFHVLPDPVDVTDPVAPVDATAIRDRVLAYLAGGTVVSGAFGLAVDELDPARPRTVPITTVTDGTWIWPGAVAHHLAAHGRWPIGAFLDHVREQDFRPPTPAPDVAAQVVAFLREQNGVAAPAPATGGAIFGSTTS